MSKADREKKIIERLEDTFYMNNGKEIKDFQKIILYEEGIQDVLQLLHIVEQEDKRIKELEEENTSKQKAYDECYCEYKHYKQFESIPKQAVIDKIKELKLSGGSDGKDNVENLVRELTIEILQELLERRK